MSQTIIPAEPTSAEAPETPQNEELLAGKFKTVDDLVASYKALESKLGQRPGDEPAPQDTPEEPEQKPEDNKDKPSDDVDPYGPVVSGALEQAGLSAQEVSDHFYQNGSLTDEHYAALEKAGFTRDIVDIYLAGVQTKAMEAEGVAEKDIKEIKSAVGGEAEYTKMLQWAAKNLSQQEQESFNAAVSLGNKDVALWAVQGLYAKFVGRTGSNPKFVRGGNGDDGPAGFASKHELVTAMKDPRYGKDAAYTQEVEQRVARSNLFQRKG